MTEPNAAACAEQVTADLADLCENRAATYQLLSRLFASEIDAELLATLKAMRLPANTGNELVDEGYRRIARYLAGFWDTSFTESSVDFSRTFVGYGMDGHAAAYPLESVYTSDKRLTMQDSRDDVMRFYRAWNLERSESMTENEDHIAIELEFMGIIALRSAQSLREGDEQSAADALAAQREFLVSHILKWARSFTADMRVFAKTDLYQGLSRLTEGFLNEEELFLSTIVSTSEGE